MFTEKNGKLFYTYDNETVCVEAWGRSALRVRITHNACLNDNDWALTEPVEAAAPRIEVHNDENASGGGFANMFAGRNDSYAAITNGGITAAFDPQGVLTFTNAAGKVLLKENWRRL